MKRESGQHRAIRLQMKTWFGVFSTSTVLPLRWRAASSIRSQSMWVSSDSSQPNSAMLSLT